MKMTNRTLHSFTALLIGSVLAIGCAEAPDTETTLTAVTVERPAALEIAIAKVRAYYFSRDFHHGAAEGDAALERWPDSSELVAWTLTNLASSSGRLSGSADEAVARAELFVESRPDDVWGAIALAFTLNHAFDRRNDGLEASLRPLELAPTMPEAVWVRGFVLHGHRQYQEAAALIEEKWPLVDRQWAELINIKGNACLAMPERRAEGLEILARVRELDPENVNAHYLAGNSLLGNRRMDEAAALLKRAAALSPGSTEIATSYWRAILAHPDLDAEEKKALISASTSEFLEQRGHPETFWQVPGFLRAVGLTAEAGELEDRVLTEFANTEGAENLLAMRWNRLSWDLRNGEAGDTVATGEELSAMLWSFINRGHHHFTSILGNAYSDLFSHMRRDESVSPDTLLLLARGALEHNRFLPHALLASGLAERGVHLDAAREIGREGIDAAKKHISDQMDFYDTPAAAADALNGLLARVYAAIGYVELKAGDLEAAREAVGHALELNPANQEVQLRAGALAEAEGDLESAEIHYAWGERLERLGPGDNPNRVALERIYTERNGTMEGYDEFIAGIGQRDHERRRQRVAATRIEEPRNLPAIDLEWLHGGRIGAEELEGRILVINFWGVWCAPCVEEAPQIQQLHEKYRDDPDVTFLTINAYDLDLDRVRRWMAENGYDYPVLVDDNFAHRHGVRSYPTTWFADTDGRIVFEYSGVSAAVYEEFVWRVEMLQAEGVAGRMPVPPNR